MVSKPYDDDDDAPTLQRAQPASGPAARYSSGLRTAVVPIPMPPLPELVDSGFEDEATTAVDRVPVSSFPAPSATSFDDTEVALPADSETNTATLPVEMVDVLRHAASRTQPPPDELDSDTSQTMIPPRAPAPSQPDV